MALWIGWVGMSLIVAGTYAPAEYSRWLFLAGASALGVSAILGKSRFYVAFQIPIIIGAITALLPTILNIVGMCTMLFGVLVAIIYLTRVRELTEWQSKAGAIGLILLAGGFASGTKAYLLPANIVLLFNAAFRLHIKREKIAIIWLVLEILAGGGTIFSIVCGRTPS
ncbi:MAG: hypothetical protein A2538_00365 [Candidatus Magasanikbacteria bacterium RIFOXYD2_FULL_41_14]|uniref:Uncharacterized protein n=1 Tax=Candidatus Magasanikbacteria bacterium RIFOXYD2_FULL_41_14 TaxID=1798709 RepID=A0A1F6PEK9_9BACT|nr:MAG: hypothetical protein A2538_00365 [Candidatus Magasanikbacteria bacterium RIFOXYD2_FULL_41_14]